MKWPNNSGVTVGCGFDLGQLASGAAGIASLRVYGFPESFVQKFAPYLGKKRVEADDFLKTHKLVLSQDEINTVNRLVMTQQAKGLYRKMGRTNRPDPENESARCPFSMK